jgi:hypothetical protein
MAHVADPNDGRLDLVPMIDTILLLLLFFILTTKFTSEDLAIRAVLPTDQGGGTGRAAVLPPPTVRVVVTPAEGGASLRIGGAEPVLLSEADFAADPQAALDRLHLVVSQRLSAFEVAGQRHDQLPVAVHAYSQLAWRWALTAFDAVRAYEKGRATTAEDARDVQLAASPRSGDELAFLMALR